MDDFPIKDKKRAVRRSQKQRKIENVRKLAERLFHYGIERGNISNGWIDEWAKKHADNLKGCSCWMCCNLRETYGDTLQEKKHLEANREDI